MRDVHGDAIANVHRHDVLAGVRVSVFHVPKYIFFKKIVMISSDHTSIMTNGYSLFWKYSGVSISLAISQKYIKSNFRVELKHFIE